MADNEDVGSISRLPEDIIHHILSFLEPKEAATRSILSKAWLTAWRTRPTLDIDFHKLIPSMKHEDKVIDYVIKNLSRYKDENIGITTFTFYCGSSFCRRSLLDSCIQLIKENGLRNLNIGLPRRDVPQSVFKVKSLLDLTLRICRLWHPKVIMCHKLKRLELSEVCLDDEMLENIVRSCPLIEILEIIWCDGIRNLNVTNLHNLKRLRLEGVQRDPMVPSELTLGEHKYQNLTSLLLRDVRINDNFFVKLGDRFPRLENLSIQLCEDVQRIKISSPSLKTIQLVNNVRLMEAQFDAPSIVLFKYHDNIGQNEIFPELSFTTTSGGWVSDICIECNGSIDASWFLKLKGFLKRLNQSQVFVTVQFQGDVTFNRDDEMTNSAAFSDRQEIQEFYVHQDQQKFSVSRAVAILDGIFWTCRPLTITQPNCNHCDSMKLHFEMLVLRSNPQNSNFQGMKFWQSDLKEVRDIEIFRFGIFTRGIAVFKEGRGLRLPQTLDWECFWKVLESHN